MAQLAARDDPGRLPLGGRSICDSGDRERLCNLPSRRRRPHLACSCHCKLGPPERGAKLIASLMGQGGTSQFAACPSCGLSHSDAPEKVRDGERQRERTVSGALGEPGSGPLCAAGINDAVSQPLEMCPLEAALKLTCISLSPCWQVESYYGPPDR